MSKAESTRVRVTVRRDVMDKAKFLAEALNLTTPTTVVGVALGLGVDMLYRGLRPDVQAALGEIMSGYIEKQAQELVVESQEQLTGGV